MVSSKAVLPIYKQHFFRKQIQCKWAATGCNASYKPWDVCKQTMLRLGTNKQNHILGKGLLLGAREPYNLHTVLYIQPVLPLVPAATQVT